MNCLKRVGTIATILIATTIGCGDDQPPTLTTGQLEVVIAASPADVVRIHLAVTDDNDNNAVIASKDLLAPQADGSWSGTVLDVPPGTDRTVTAEAFDADDNKTFEGSTSGVTVFAGKLTTVAITLKPTGGTTFPLNTPPHFVSLIHPASILSSETPTLFATADDPDPDRLSYTWRVVSGGGTLSVLTVGDQDPGDEVSTVYTPVSGFTGFAVIEVAVSDGTATTTTTFAIAVGAGLLANLSFDVLPDLTLTLQRQSLMPGDTSDITFKLTNPNQPWTPSSMQVTASWTASCGTIDETPETITIAKNTTSTDNTVTTVITYTAPPTQPVAKSCKLSLKLVDLAGVEMTFTFNVWIDLPMVMFVSSAPVTGATFLGQWENADAFCQNLADAPASVKTPPGTYHALLSFDEISAKDRLIDAPYVDVDGAVIARNKEELYSLALLNAISKNELGVVNASAVFTGTNGDGSTGANCGNWTLDSGNATAGLSSSSATPNWTNNAPSLSPCGIALPIYCVQDNIPQV